MVDEEMKARLLKAGLTEKQTLFCFFYLQDFNATLAAQKAGYSPRSARSTGCRLLKNKKIAKVLKLLKLDMAHSAYVDAVDVLDMYAKIAFADIRDYIDVTGSGKNAVVELKNLDQMDGQVIEEVISTANGVRLKLCDRMRALEKLEKYFDLLSESWRRDLEERKLELSLEKKGNSMIQVISRIPRPQNEPSEKEEDSNAD